MRNTRGIQTEGKTLLLFHLGVFYPILHFFFFIWVERDHMRDSAGQKSCVDIRTETLGRF
jgi:hypothetical protein